MDIIGEGWGDKRGTSKVVEARMQFITNYQKWRHDGQQIRVVRATVTALNTSENVSPQLLKLKFKTGDHTQ